MQRRRQLDKLGGYYSYMHISITKKQFISKEHNLENHPHI